YTARNNVDEGLQTTRDKLMETFHKETVIPDTTRELTWSLVKTDTAKRARGEQLKDVDIYNPFEDEMEPYRQLQMVIALKGSYYVLTIQKSLLEFQDMILAMILTEAGFVILLLVGFNVMSNRIQQSLWTPFYSILDRIRSFQLNSRETDEPETTQIDEFREMGESVTQMTGRIRRDYEHLKEFTENASHELQTPLAVVRSKLERVFSHPDLTEEQASLMGEAYEAANRMERINKALLLLARIENRQYHETENVNLSELVNKELGLVGERLELHKINMVIDLEEDLTIHMNAHLAEVLVRNLVANAIKHNEDGGAIKIKLDSEKLLILNTGPAPAVEPERLFERFTKANPASSSLGLGLSIVKSICDFSNFGVTYTYLDRWHIIEVEFQNDAAIKSADFPK
ncbi:MAG TPA: HAMP domain-containing sensor histidine kinase, partial [Balneolales bacterium]|nr:HAMP domain-containing sensor histidine kinase [Balneolales bacterium]